MALRLLLDETEQINFLCNACRQARDRDPRTTPLNTLRRPGWEQLWGNDRGRPHPFFSSCLLWFDHCWEKIASGTRDGMARKLSLLNLLCNSHGMIIYMKKTYFLLSMLSWWTVAVLCRWNDNYIWSVSTSDGCLSWSIIAQAQAHLPFFIYLSIFGKKECRHNFLCGKKTPWSLTHVCRSWVHMLTWNDMYYFEMGMSPLQLHVAQRQWKLFRNSWNEMREMVGGAWVYAVKRVLVLLYMIYIARERMLQRSIE